ncbi:MAG: NYN domain-containing protein [Deltaproteobacteria bacterium]|nr:NYN domain-containing protein [Deltaproteobacteria bacterium]
MIVTTPKFKSAAFKATLAQIKEILDAHTLGMILLDALERRTAEQIVTRYGRPDRGRRFEQLKKSDLVGQITAWFFSIEDVAYAVIKEMDRLSQKECYIVRSIPDDQAEVRVGSYRAIALKRERAKYVWALVRDERANVRGLANKVIHEFFQEVADLATTRQILEGDRETPKLNDAALAERIQEQALRLSEASERLSDLEARSTKQETERARLLVQLGAKERELREATDARGELEAEMLALRKSLKAVELEYTEAEDAKAREADAQASAEALAQKVRRLEKLAGASKTLIETQAALTEARSRAEALSETLSRTDHAHRAREDAHAEVVARLTNEVETLKAELRRARQQLARGVADAPEAIDAIEGIGASGASGAIGAMEASSASGASGAREVRDVREVARARDEAVAVLLDQANIAASAQAMFRRKVDFGALLQRLTAGRRVKRAVAFVVDNGGSSFDAFCDHLRKMGWTLRIKRPRRSPDGRVKADWDMGIAMEALEVEAEVGHIVLVSGDGDFVPLVQRLKRRKVVVEVAAFHDAFSPELFAAADDAVRLGEDVLEVL